MTKNQFDEFIAKYELYSFDGLIEITHADGSIHRGVWITSTPPLDKSMDGKFAGKDEYETFYLFESDKYVIWRAEEISAVKCIQQGYLKGIPYQLAE